MTGILSNFDNVDTFEEKDEILNAYIKQIVNNTDDSNSEETALQQLIEFALNNKKKSKFNNNNYKKNIVVMDNDEYYFQAQIAVECANILISLILNKGQTQEQQYIYNKSEPLKAAAFLTLCELCKPTTYFSNKIDGQNIDIVQLTESFNISVNGLIDATLSTKLFEKIVLQKNNV